VAIEAPLVAGLGFGDCWVRCVSRRAAQLKTLDGGSCSALGAATIVALKNAQHGREAFDTQKKKTKTPACHWRLLVRALRLGAHHRPVSVQSG